MDVMDWIDTLLAKPPAFYKELGMRVLAKLPIHERQPFVDWVVRNYEIASDYERYPGLVLRKWLDSTERMMLDAPET